MKTDRREEARYLLRKLLREQEADVITEHPWLWERARWSALVTALLARVSSVPREQLMHATEALDDLGLLAPRALASLTLDRPADQRDPLARHFLEHLREAGFSDAESERGLLTICEAARGLERHGGKVQRYLRGYGEQMLREIDQVFTFTALDSALVADAVTDWLQTTLNMPLSLMDARVRRFCADHGLDPADLAAGADDLDMSFALMDDLIHRHMNTMEGAARRAQEATDE